MDNQEQIDLVVNKINSYKRPNAKAAETLLNKLEEDYDINTSDAIGALEEYNDIVREDYDDPADYREAREEAWYSFLSALDDLDPEEDEEE